jgi:hypothetical protein
VPLSRKNLSTIAGFTTALILVVSQANAQIATFTLPFPAHVGKTTLTPGEYQLRVTAGPSPVPAAYLYRDGKLVATAAVMRQPTQEANGSYLQVLGIGGSHYISKFVSSGSGAVFTFAIPGAARHEILADTRATRISTNGGDAN